MIGLSIVVPLAEAATFTFGCAVLHARWLNPERVSMALVGVAELLTAAVLLALTPENVCLDPNALDPASVWPLAVEAELQRSERDAWRDAAGKHLTTDARRPAPCVPPVEPRPSGRVRVGAGGGNWTPQGPAQSP